MSNALTKQDLSCLLFSEDDDMKTLLKSNEILKERKSQRIEFAKPILYLNDLPFIFPNTICVCQGKTGVHKSRFVETIISSLLCKNQDTDNLLGITTNNEFNYVVIHFDTERNIKDQLPYAIQKIEQNAGGDIKESFENYLYFSLIDIDRSRRLDVINKYLSNFLINNFGSHNIIVIDVLSDLVLNFNDPGESLLFIDMLNQMINSFDVTFILVIHENPGTDKSRGHLGTEIQNKASMLFRIAPVNNDIKKNDDEFKTEFIKCRTIKRLETIYIKYSEKEHCLIKIDAKEPTNEKRLKANLYEVISYLQDSVFSKQIKKCKKDLHKDLTIEFECSENTVRHRLKQIVYDKMTLIIDGKKYHLDDNGRDYMIIAYK